MVEIWSTNAQTGNLFRPDGLITGGQAPEREKMTTAEYVYRRQHLCKDVSIEQCLPHRDGPLARSLGQSVDRRFVHVVHLDVGGVRDTARPSFAIVNRFGSFGELLVRPGWKKTERKACDQRLGIARHSCPEHLPKAWPWSGGCFCCVFTAGLDVVRSWQHSEDLTASPHSSALPPYSAVPSSCPVQYNVQRFRIERQQINIQPALSL